MCANPFDKLGLDPLLIAEVKNSRNPEEFKKFLKEFRDTVAMALHPDRMKDIKSTYLPAVLEAYDKIKNLNNGNLDSSVEDFLQSAAKDDSEGMVVKLEQLATIVENLEEDYNAAQRRVTTLEAERNVSQRKIESFESRVDELKSDASMYRMEGERLRIDMKQERAKHSRDIQRIRQGVDRRGFLKGFGIGLVASLIGYGGVKLVSGGEKKNIAPSKPATKKPDAPKKARPQPVHAQVTPNRNDQAAFAAASLYSLIPQYAEKGEVEGKKSLTQFLMKESYALDDANAIIDKYSRIFNIPKSKMPEHAKALGLYGQYLVYHVNNAAIDSSYAAIYFKDGDCGAIKIIQAAYILPRLENAPGSKRLFFDTKGLEAIASGKAKVLRYSEYSRMYSSSHQVRNPLYWTLCDYIGLKKDGGR